ncbi:hypothetical protein OIV83_004520 [Microbotryomycetes sp. JL201]|nr:hypothetical protein OIV83_004520 [Microbotryomycetes sp. JL201]
MARLLSAVRLASRQALYRPARPGQTLVAVRHASNVKDVPRPAGHDNVPFKAPPVDTTQGELGQVFMPDTEAIERVVEPPTRIPADPDSFTAPTNRDDDFPFLHEPRVITAAHPQTFPDGSGPSHGSTSDDAVIEQLHSDDSSSSSSSGKDSAKGGVPKNQDVNGNYKYTYDDKPLTDDERKGALQLVGLLVAGWLLGGLGNRTNRHERKPEAQVSTP